MPYTLNVEKEIFQHSSLYQGPWARLPLFMELCVLEAVIPSSSEWHRHTRSQEDSLGKPPNSISRHFFEKTELGHENVWNMGAMLLIFT